MKNRILIAALCLLATPAAAEVDTFKLWGRNAVPHAEDLQAFKNWDAVNYREDHIKITDKVIGWHRFLHDIAPHKMPNQIEEVNNYFAECDRTHSTQCFPYVTDTQNYWPDVREFLDNSGDCKGYALAKYFSLIDLGFDPKNMAIVVLQDQKLGQIHAVLAVFLNGEIKILDNQVTQVKNAEDVQNYLPIYAITKGRYWTFTGHKQ